jgi:hypothetical protein
MTTILKATCMSAVLLFGVALLPGVGGADDAKAIPSPKVVLTALAEAGKPGAEHQKLAPFIGEWNVTMRMWTDPSQPPAELTATAESKWILGGRFVQESLRGECPEGKSFEAIGFLGYDAAQKKFTTVRVCGFCGKTMTNALAADASGRKFECATEECCPLTGEKVKGRDEVVVENNDRIVTSIYKTMHGKEFKAMEVVATRRK